MGKRLWMLLTIWLIALGLISSMFIFASGSAKSVSEFQIQTTPDPDWFPPDNPYEEIETAQADADDVSAGTFEELYRSEQGVQVAPGNNGATTAFPAAYRWTSGLGSSGEILLYADDAYHTSTLTYPDQALQFLGLNYTAHYDNDFAGFETSLASGNWDLVIFANDAWGPPATTLGALDAYVAAGGKLILNSWVVGLDPGHPLWASLGFSFVSSDFDPPDPVEWWVPSHPFFTDPRTVPEFSTLVAGRYVIFGQRVEPLPGFQALAGYTSVPLPNEAALIVSPDSRTVFRGFLDGHNDADLDTDSVPDGVELWINLILNTAVADVEVVKTDSADPVMAGGVMTYSLAVTNNGPNAATNVVLTDTLPAGTSLIDLAPGVPVCSESAGIVTCDLGIMAAGESMDITLTVSTPSAVTALLNNAVVVADEPDHIPGNNSVTEQTLVVTSLIPHTCGVAGNPVANCSFETGNFSFWFAQDLIVPYIPLTVTATGPFPPTDGIFTALHGFDGGGPGTILVAQDVELPLNAQDLIFDYRANWDLVTFAPPGTLDRHFHVDIEPLFGGPAMQSTAILTATAGSIVGDTGNLSGIVDVSDFAGSPVRISFEWDVPQNFTGPALFMLDNVLVTVEDPDIDVAPPGASSQQLPDKIVVQPLNIDNLGTGDLDWAFVENPLGIASLASPPGKFVAGDGTPLSQGQGDEPAYSNIESGFVPPSPAGSAPKLSLAPVIEAGGYTYYNDRAAFDADFPGLPIEDFEEGKVPPAGVTTCNAPLDHRLTNPCFDAGDILPGLTLEDNPPGSDFFEFALLGAGFGPVQNTSKVVGPNFFAEDTDLFFNYYDVHQVGLDLFSGLAATDIVTITIYGSSPAISDVVTATTNMTGTFWGVSSAEPISRISIASQFGNGELLDNLAMTAPACEPVPWAAASPLNAITPPAGTSPVDVTFDSTGLVPGTYSGNLCVLSDDPDEPLVIIPLSLTVNHPAYLPYISKE